MNEPPTIRVLGCGGDYEDWPNPKYNPESELSSDSNSAFLGNREPIGTIINLYKDKDTPFGRTAKAFFESWMMNYFGELRSGGTGWGVSFNDWLEINGWKLVDTWTYQRVMSVREGLS